LAAVFLDDEIFSCFACFLVLGCAFLAGTLFQVDVLLGEACDVFYGG